MWKQKGRSDLVIETNIVRGNTSQLKQEQKTCKVPVLSLVHLEVCQVSTQQQHSLFSQASWGRLEMKPERNKFKVQAH